MTFLTEEVNFGLNKHMKFNKNIIGVYFSDRCTQTEGSKVEIDKEYWEEVFKQSAQDKLKNIKSKKTIMSNVIDFAKNLALSSDEKLLRKHGLHDQNGNKTGEAMQLVKDLEARDRGYKDEQDMLVKLGVTDDEYVDYSPLELDDMFKSHEEEIKDIISSKEESETSKK